MTRPTKILLIVLTLVIFLCIAAGIFWWKGKHLAIEDVLPQGALAYVKFSDVQKNWKEASSTNLWQSLRAIDFTRGGQDSHWTQQQKDVLASIREKLSDPAIAVALEQFFGREFAVALYPLSAPSLPSSPLTDKETYTLMRDIFSRFLLVTRLEDKAPFMEFFSQWLGLTAKDMTHEAIPVDGYTLHRVTLPHMEAPISFVYFQDLLVIGIDEPLVRQTIETQRGQTRALASDRHFRRSQQRMLASPEMAGYLDMKELFSYINTLFDALMGPTQEAMKTSLGNGNQRATDRDVAKAKAAWQEMFRRVAGQDVLGFSGRWENNIARLKFDLYFDEDKLDPLWAETYSCPPARNEALSFVPADVLGYQWSNCLDWEVSWREVKQEVARAQERFAAATSPVEALESALGLNIEEDILPAFADKMGGYLRDIHMGSLSPVPDLLFFVEVKDIRKVGHIVRKLDERFASSVQQEDYNGISLHYLVSPVGKDIEPAYGILGKYFLIAFNRTTLKDAIDRHQTRLPTLSASEDFRQAVSAGEGQNRFIQFVRVDELIRRLEDVVQWGRARVAAQEAQKAAFQSGSAKRLADVMQEIQDKKKELEDAKKETSALEVEGAELNQLKERAVKLEEEIAAGAARQKELEEIQRGYDRYLADRKKKDERDKYIVQPLLQSLAFIRLWGMNTTLNNGALESTVFWKVE